MKKTLTVVLIFSAFTSFAQKQKVKEKDNIYYVDDKPFLKKDCKYEYQEPCPFSSPEGNKKYFVMKPNSYQDTRQEYIAGTQNTVMKQYTVYVFQVQFLSVEKEFYTKEIPKDLIKLMFNANIISPTGDVDEAKLDEFIKINGIEPPIIIKN